MKRKPMATGLTDFSSREIANIERRLFMRRGLSLGALTLLSGCDITDKRGSAKIAMGNVAMERQSSGMALRSFASCP